MTDDPLAWIMDDPRYTAAVEDARAALAVAFHGREAVDIVRELAMTDPGAVCRYCGETSAADGHGPECIWLRARDLLVRILDLGT